MNQNTYIVQWETKAGNIKSLTLRQWCELKNKSYDTAISRIVRSDANRKTGVYFFSPKDKVLSGLPFREGVPANKDESPSRKLKGNDIGTRSPINKR